MSSGKKGKGSKDGTTSSNKRTSFNAKSMHNRSRFEVEPKWVMDSDFKPPRKISDMELEAARKLFFELDRDGSGSIDADELGVMLRSLGQNPTDEEVQALIASVDDGDKDGQIQLREFLRLYADGLDTKSKGQTSKNDVKNVFSSLGGDPTMSDSKISKTVLLETFMDQYDLDVDIESLFGKVPGQELSKEDFEKLLIAAA